jgi:hypothetical protein
MSETPRQDPRDARTIVAQTEALVEAFTPWRRGPALDLDGVGALIRVFARMAARGVAALNEAPQVQIEALLELLGVRPRPPRAARVPLVFRLAEGATVDVAVPVRTQVGSRVDDEVVFETLSALTVVRAGIAAVRVLDPAGDRWGERDTLLGPGLVAPAAAFLGDAAVERALYLECESLLALPGLLRVELALDFSASLGDPGKLGALPIRLEHWDGASWRAFAGAPAASLVEGQHRLLWAATPAPALRPCVVDGRTATWLKVCVDSEAMVGWWRHAGGFTASDEISVAEALRAVPTLVRAAIMVKTRSPAAAPDTGRQSGRSVDVSRDFYPFDVSPQLGASFALGLRAAVAAPAGSEVALVVKVHPAPPVAPAAADTLELVWELRGAAGWRELGRSSKTAVSSAVGTNFTDSTMLLTTDGSVTFTLPTPPVAGDDGCWLRVWIAAGDYGKPVSVDHGVAPSKVSAATYAPPLLRALSLSLDFTSPPQPPSGARLAGDFRVVDRGANLQGSGPAFALFAPQAEPGPALYIGLAAAPGAVPVSLYVGVAPLRPAEAELPAGIDPPRVQWELRGAGGWTPVGVADETAALTVSGLVRFTAPADLPRTLQFGRELCWLRARWVGGVFRGPPRLTAVRLNAVWARHAAAIEREVLGSGDGASGRTFTTQRKPVLAGEQVWVREQAGASASEAEAWVASVPAGEVALEAVDDGVSVWIRWRPVVDLRASGPEDRHYVLRSDAGELSFGDGRRGRLLPRGRNNLRIDYAHGGGRAGNSGPNTITELRTSLPYVARVEHDEPATGGADGEATPDLAGRGPAALRHGDRGVAGRDLEDLAREASQELAQVKAIVPRFDPLEIAVDLGALDRSGVAPAPGAPVLSPGGRVMLPAIPPETASVSSTRAGKVRLLVVPRGDEDRPVPSAGLLAQVERHVAARSSPLMRLEVTGPRWVEVAVRCRIVATSHERAELVCADVAAALRRFLHPLHGGQGGAGWPFGRAPRRSDLGRVIARVAGVDHLRGLEMRCTPALPEVDDALTDDQLADLQRVMIYSGTHDVTLLGVVGEGGL